jgi:hypothetical protein
MPAHKHGKRALTQAGAADYIKRNVRFSGCSHPPEGRASILQKGRENLPCRSLIREGRSALWLWAASLCQEPI